MQGKLVIISAPSGSGKTTIVNRLLAAFPDLEFSISATSRSPREGEKDGINYYFLSPSEFREKINKKEFVEWEEVYNNKFYGTLRSELERIWGQNHHVIFDVDVKGALSLKKEFGGNALAIFIRVPDLSVLEERLRGRETEDEETIRIRIEKAAWEAGFEPEFDRTVINDQLEKAVSETMEIVKAFLENKTGNA